MSCLQKFRSTRGFASGVSKAVVKGAAARLELLKGCEELADVVGSTLGPKGRNVVIFQKYGAPKVTKDGVSVAKEFELKNSLQKLGADLVKEVAQQTNEKAGDGTTTATVLAREIFKGGCEAVAAGMNPMDVLRGIKRASALVHKELEKASCQIKGRDDLFNIAKISANSDEAVGKLIADAMDKVGRDGVITVTDGKTLSHELEVVNGYKFDRGFISPFFITDAKTNSAVLENPYLLLVDKKLGNVQELIPLLEEVLKSNRPLLLIAEDFESELLSTLILNKLRGGFSVCAVKSPGFGNFRLDYIQDLAALTGGRVIKLDGGEKLAEIKVSDLGQAKKVVVSRDDCLILEGAAIKSVLETQVQTLRIQRNRFSASEYEKEKLQERLAKLTGGVALIKIGGSSELEVAEVKERVEDALCATRAAVEGGYLPGGGAALLHASRVLEKLTGKNDAETAGIKVVLKACNAPLRKIASNAGFEGSVVAEKVYMSTSGDKYGFDANTGEYANLVERGIIDPTKVVTSALMNAASVAALMTTTEGCIYEDVSSAPSLSEGGISAAPTLSY